MKLWILTWMCAGNCLHSGDTVDFFRGRQDCESAALDVGFRITNTRTDPVSCGDEGGFLTCPAIIPIPHSIPPYVTYGVCEQLTTSTGDTK